MKKKLKKAIKRVIKAVVHGMAIVVALGIVMLGLIIGKLYAEPMNITELLPALESYILPEGSNLKLQAKSAMLKASLHDEGLLHIDVADLALVRPDGKIALKLDDVQMSYGLWHIVSLNYMPDTLRINRVVLRIEITPEGNVRLSNRGENEPEETADGVWLKGDGAPDIDKTIERLLAFNALALNDISLYVDDQQQHQRLSIPNMDILMEKQFGFNHAIQMSGMFKIQKDLTRFNVQAEYNRMRKHMSFDAEVDALYLKNLARVIPVLAGADLTVAANVEGMLNLSKPAKSLSHLVGKGTFQLKTETGGTLNLPEPLTNLYHIKTATINGAWEAGLKNLKIGKSAVWLKNGPKADLEVTVAGLDRLIDANDLNAVKTVLDAHISSLPMVQVPDVWPPATGPDAHAWVKQNLKSGTVDKADFTLYFTGGELVNLYGEMPVRGVRVDYLSPMKPVDDFAGLVRLYPDKVLISGTQGRVGNLNLTTAQVDLINLQDEIAQADIRLNVVGPVAEALDLIAQKPLEFPQLFGIDPAKTGGNATVQVDLKFPLIEDLNQNQVRVKTKAAITNGGFPTPAEAYRLENGALNLVVDNNALRLNGTGTVAGIPLTLKWVESFTAEKNDEIQTRYDIAGQVPIATIQPLYPAATDWGNGTVGLTGKITKTVADIWTIQGDLNLKAAAVNLYPISVKKPVGVPLTGKITLTGAGQTWHGEASIQGYADTQSKQPIKAQAHFATGDGLKIELDNLMAPGTIMRGRFEADAKQRAVLRLDAESWNMQDWMTLEKAAEKTDAPAGEMQPVAPWPDIDMDMAVGKLTLVADKPLTGVKIIGRRQGFVWDSLILTATGKEAFTVNYTPLNRLLRAQTNDLGDLLERLGISDRIQGGRLVITAEQSPLGVFTGTANMQHFNLKTPGFLVQAFTILGIVNGIFDQDLSFDRVEVPFTLTPVPNLTLTIQNGVMSGTTLGLTFAGDVGWHQVALTGAVIPAYAINSLPGKIPLVGALFRDGQGGGLVGVKYETTGTPWAPQVTFKTLGSMAPGILGRLF